MIRKDETRYVRQFLRGESGAVAVEYGVIVTAMFPALVSGFLYVSSALGNKLLITSDFFGGS